MEQKAGFFVRRPIFATVISLVILLVGFLSIKALPVEQYPDMTPPTVNITATYTGASADVISQNVASIIELSITGVEGMIYMTSSSTATEGVDISVIFANGTDPDQATINVTNRVQRVLNKLPQEVQRMGVTVAKSTTSMVAMISLTSPDNTYDNLRLSNYATLNIVEELKLVPGVGNARNLAGQVYAMRVWLDNRKMTNYNITASEIEAAIMAQNAQFAVGRIGEPPMPNIVDVTWQVLTFGRLNTPEELGNVVLRSTPDGGVLRLKDVATVLLGAEDAHFKGFLNGNNSVPIGVYLAPGANALAVSDGIKAKMVELEKYFPAGITYSIPMDATVFVKISIQNVIKTLIEALILVFLVVFLFLQNIRATLIPVLAVPVSIIGTFAGMYALGFTINTLTMFGLVLAIGIVVDDAIVVLENVERHMALGLTPFRATSVAMREVTRPIIAIVLVLSSVFIPIAFLGGLAGQMYKQFAITIVVSVTISGIVALTLTPALCALLLTNKKHEPSAPFRLFNTLFDYGVELYLTVVRFMMRHVFVTLVVFGLFVAGTAYFYMKLPSGLLPDEDQGRVMGIVVLPDGASLPRSTLVVERMNELFAKEPSIDVVTSFAGLDILSGGMKTNYVSFMITMKDWSERGKGESSYDLVKKIQAYEKLIPEGEIIALNPPPIMGMGSAGGFEMWVQNRIGDSYEQMHDYVTKFEQAAAKRPELAGVSSTFSVSAPQLIIDVDRNKVAARGVQIAELFKSLQTSFSSYYVNDFNMFGRTYKIFLQSEDMQRALPDDVKKLYVKNDKGEMLPVSSFLTVSERGGSQTINRFNNFPSAQFVGDTGQGFTAGDAMRVAEELAKDIFPAGYTVAWSGVSYQMKESSSGTIFVFALALIMVFLVLAAQYESWSLPISVLFAAPFAIFGAALANNLVGYANDIYFQVAIVTLIGLSAKNAILIIEFAVERYRGGGVSIDEAALEGTKLRFRPIIMTSLAFIAGCIPLAISSGAGSASRAAIGVSVIGGMLVSTVIAPLFTPFFFKVVMSLSETFFGRQNIESTDEDV